MEDGPTVNNPASPLTGPPPAQVPLTDAPLVRVIAQVRYPIVASIEKQEFIAAFQEAIREDYPVLRAEQGQTVVLGPQGVIDARSNAVWRFQEVNGAWTVTLAPNFLALETRRYTDRAEFLQRLRSVLQALKENVNLEVVDRLGIRYVDQVSGENLQDLHELVRPEVAGILSTPLKEQVQHTIAENVFNLPQEEGQVTARWGRVPAQVTLDPAVIDVLDEPSWLLDIDAFREETQPCDVDAITDQAESLAERIYSIFRWCVTEEFLVRYGSER